MAITVIFPNALRPLAAGNDRVPLSAGTVGEALQKLVARYPALDGKLPAPSGNGQAIFRNSVTIDRLQGLETPLRDGDRLVLIVPAGEL
jgi:molybdopterin converting factor small subunit